MLPEGQRKLAQDMAVANDYLQTTDIATIIWLAPGTTKKRNFTLVIGFYILTKANRALRQSVILYGQHYATERYFSNLRILQCSNCTRFGYNGIRCRAVTQCTICAGKYAILTCIAPPSLHRCARCNGPYKVTNANCPKRFEFIESIRQKRLVLGPFFPSSINSINYAKQQYVGDAFNPQNRRNSLDPPTPSIKPTPAPGPPTKTPFNIKSPTLTPLGKKANNSSTDSFLINYTSTIIKSTRTKLQINGRNIKQFENAAEIAQTRLRNEGTRLPTPKKETLQKFVTETAIELNNSLLENTRLRTTLKKCKIFNKQFGPQTATLKREITQTPAANPRAAKGQKIHHEPTIPSPLHQFTSSEKEFNPSQKLVTFVDQAMRAFRNSSCLNSEITRGNASETTSYLPITIRMAGLVNTKKLNTDTDWRYKLDNAGRPMVKPPTAGITTLSDDNSRGET